MKKQPKTFSGKIVKRVQRHAAPKFQRLNAGEETDNDELETMFKDYNIDQELGDEASAGTVHFYPIAAY